jgi:hypothetical protein
VLLSLGDEFEVVLEEVDILTDPQVYELYKYTIPVMIVDGKIKLEARITREKLWRALAEGYGPKVEG